MGKCGRGFVKTKKLQDTSSAPLAWVQRLAQPDCAGQYRSPIRPCATSCLPSLSPPLPPLCLPSPLNSVLLFPALTPAFSSPLPLPASLQHTCALSSASCTPACAAAASVALQRSASVLAACRCTGVMAHSPNIADAPHPFVCLKHGKADAQPCGKSLLDRRKQPYAIRLSRYAPTLHATWVTDSKRQQGSSKP